MDIELTEMNGIEAATKINQVLKDCHIVYLSKHLHYATDVYSTEHRYYVIKSEFHQRINEVYKKIKRMVVEKEERVVVKLISES